MQAYFLNNLLKFVGLVITTLSLPSMALAAIDDPIPTQPSKAKVIDNRLQIGASVITSDKGFKDYDNDIKVLPAVFYDNGRLYARGNQVGINLIKNTRHEVGLLAQYAGDSYQAENAKGAYQQLDDRDSSVMLGASYQYQLKYAGIRGQIARDVSSHSDGTTARLSVATRLPIQRWTAYPAIGLQWQDANYNDYYYGVTQTESQRTGIRTYHPKASVNPFISATANYPITKDWQLFVTPSISYNSNEIYNSPKVDNRIAWSTAIGLTYKIR